MTMIGAPVNRSMVRYYAKAEQIVAESEHLQGIHLILSGQVALTICDPVGKVSEVARLGRGEFFGEKALLADAISDVTATAAEDVELLILNSAVLQPLLERVPQLGREIGDVMEARRKSLREMRAATRRPEAAGNGQANS
jgi:CRP-like cAMP-binding protein